MFTSTGNQKEKYNGNHSRWQTIINKQTRFCASVLLTFILDPKMKKRTLNESVSSMKHMYFSVVFFFFFCIQSFILVLTSRHF